MTSAEHERVVRRDEDEVGTVLPRELDEPRNVGCLERYAFGERRDAAVAGRAVDGAAVRAFLDLADDGVLTAAAADDEYIHKSRCSSILWLPLG